MTWRADRENPIQRLKDWAVLIVCNLIWASQFVLVKLVQKEMGFIFATFFPMAIAMLILVPFVIRERSRDMSCAQRRISVRDAGSFILLGVFGQIAAQLCVTWGTNLSTASNSALLFLTLPVITSVMAYFFLGERMTWIRLISFCLALLGVLASSGIDIRELSYTGQRSLLGNALIFVSIAGSAFYNVFSKRLMRRYSALEVLLYSYIAAFAFMLPLAISLEPSGFSNLPHYSGTVWIGLAMLAVVQYALSMVMFLRVLSRIDATQAAIMNYLIPFLGVVIAWAILDERLTVFMILGGVLAAASTLLATVVDKPQTSQPTV
jgi:drug/metabolite transporter (DMT)-like permease